MLPPGSTPQSDNALAFAVQARVLGGTPGVTGLAGYQFTIAIAGEPESNGALAKHQISNTDGTYAANASQTVSQTVGRGGLASQYSYLAGINPNYNGLINISGGTFPNGPDQEIGLINGHTAGSPLLLVVDPDGSGVQWPNTLIGRTFFGVDGSWVDIYRFKYTLTEIATPRVATVTLVSPQAEVFDELQVVNGEWGPVPRTATVTSQSLTIPIAPLAACCQPSGACAVTAAGSCATGLFVASSTCAPSTCDALGRCCARATPSFCLITTAGDCGVGSWSASASCTPDPCALVSGVCCDATSGACTVAPANQCSQLWIGAVTCSTTPCPQPGACCLSLSATCVFVTEAACSNGTWAAASACSAAVCPFGACCRGGACSVTAPALCAGFVGQYRGTGSSCLPLSDPNRCCTANFNGQNSVTVQDIFDFLSAFFIGDPHANINADTIVSVQDIMDFLNAWFAGC